MANLLMSRRGHRNAHERTLTCTRPRCFVFKSMQSCNSIAGSLSLTHTCTHTAHHTTPRSCGAFWKPSCSSKTHTHTRTHTYTHAHTSTSSHHPQVLRLLVEAELQQEKQQRITLDSHGGGGGGRRFLCTYSLPTVL